MCMRLCVHCVKIPAYCKAIKKKVMTQKCVTMKIITDVILEDKKCIRQTRVNIFMLLCFVLFYNKLFC